MPLDTGTNLRPRRAHRWIAFVGVPAVRSGRVDRRIGIRQAAHIGMKRIGAFVIRQPIAEIFEEFGPENLRRAHEGPLDFAARAEKNRPQHEARGALGVRLRIGECQRRTPRAANDEPFIDIEMPANGFDVGDEMLCCVGIAGEMRMTAPGAALIE